MVPVSGRLGCRSTGRLGCRFSGRLTEEASMSFWHISGCRENLGFSTRSVEGWLVPRSQGRETSVNNSSIVDRHILRLKSSRNCGKKSKSVILRSFALIDTSTRNSEIKSIVDLIIELATKGVAAIAGMAAIAGAFAASASLAAVCAALASWSSSSLTNSAEP